MDGELTRYRVWADGWVSNESEEPCSWRSDDFMVIYAEDEAAALAEFERRDASWLNGET